jgi:hypothetical protein
MAMGRGGAKGRRINEQAESRKQKEKAGQRFMANVKFGKVIRSCSPLLEMCAARPGSSDGDGVNFDK